MRRRWLAIGMTALTLLAACSDDSGTEAGPEPEPDTTDASVVDPATVTIHRVLAESSPPCDEVAVAAGQLVVADPPDGCLLLGPAEVDARSVAHAGIAAVRDDFADVTLELDDDGALTLDDMALEQYPMGRVAIVVDGRLVGAPTVEQPEFGGSVAVMGLTTDEAMALVTALGGDPTLPEPDAGDPLLQRAATACESQGPDGRPTVASSPTTAGSITAALGEEAIEPWRSLPTDHFVARCTYAWYSVDAPPTTVCPDGEAVSLRYPDQWLVDDEGRSSPDPTAIRGPVSPCGEG